MNDRSLGITHQQRVVRFLHGQKQVMKVYVLPEFLWWFVVRDPARDIAVFTGGRREFVESGNGSTEEDEISP